jgi:hypothetical protein
MKRSSTVAPRWLYLEGRLKIPKTLSSHKITTMTTTRFSIDLMEDAMGI